MVQPSGVYGVGDNKEFMVATAKDITIYFYNSESKTSVNDDPTAGNYYIDNLRVAKEIIVRYDQTIQILKVGCLQNTNFTDPISCAIGDGTVEPASGIWKEVYEGPIAIYIQVRILTDNTSLKVRVY